MEEGGAARESTEPPLPGDAPPGRRVTGPVPPPVPPGGWASRRQTSWTDAILHSSITYICIGLAGAAAIFFGLGQLGYFSLPFVYKTLPSGVQPCITALEFTTYTFLIGLGLALGLGMVRAHPPHWERKKKRRPKARGRFSALWRWPLYGFVTGYVQAIRGTPFLVQLFIVYLSITFTWPTFTYFGWNQFYWCGFLALLINTTGYQTEAIRGGIQAVEAGQIEGAKAVGLTKVQTFVRVTMPQTLRLITLPLTNEWISNFKTATILSYIPIFELFNWASTDIAFLDARPLEAFVMLTLFYLIINVTLSRVITYVEKVRRIPGLGTPIPEVGVTKRIFGTGMTGDRSGGVR